jgi:hypothetical protein
VGADGVQTVVIGEAGVAGRLLQQGGAGRW